MTGRTIALTIIGFLVGMLAAGSIGVRVIEEVRAEDDATSLPPENVSSTTPSSDEYFLDPRETLIASAAVIPTDVVGTGASVSVEYEIISLAPGGLSSIVGVPNLYPASWRVSIDGDTVAGGLDGPDSRVVTFELPAGSDAGDIVAVDIVDPLVAYPLDALFHLSDENRSVWVTAGVQVELVSTTDRSDGTVVRLEILTAKPTDVAFTIEGSGPGWSSDKSLATSTEIELLWVGGEPPDTLTFRAVGIQWVALEGVYPVSFEGF